MARSQLHVVISSLLRGVNCHRTRKLFNLDCKSPSNPNHDTLAPFSKEVVELIGGQVLNPGVSVKCLRFPVHY